MSTVAQMGRITNLVEDDPLMESGLDSLTAIEFRNSIAESFPMFRLPVTLTFDYPTIRELSSYLITLQGRNEISPTTPDKRPLTPKIVMGIVDHLVGAAEMTKDKSLLEAGLDSLTAVEFRNRLVRECPSCDLLATLVFDRFITHALS